ncbi:hypothetical protein NDU88_004862 [Pleurodeles waltl]|uniref:Uncharacterized protein n=1 Tax=Pleurodeles waltl TaxID=8319 RepID=A0AAV7LVW4_PLEWA|nr:hypothetical protein NDU88_004862 [Pleurodeles waltl]
MTGTRADPGEIPTPPRNTDDREKSTVEKPTRSHQGQVSFPAPMWISLWTDPGTRETLAPPHRPTLT